MTRPIYLIGGGKGGVGKSLRSMAVVDFLGCRDQAPFLVETDTSVPDVYKMYQTEVGGELVNLNEREGWIELVNFVESRPGSTFVINPVRGIRPGSATSAGRSARRCRS